MLSTGPADRDRGEEPGGIPADRDVHHGSPAHCPRRRTGLCCAIIGTEEPHRIQQGETAMPAPGNKAPAFTLPNQDGKKVKLTDFKGKTLLLFAYPKAATSG